jgi:4-hydroxybenzoate polyprenyltransferase
MLTKFLSLIRFSHTVFALPFALTSAALAWKKSGMVRWPEPVGILLCMAFARAAAWLLTERPDDAGIHPSASDASRDRRRSRPL